MRHPIVHAFGVILLAAAATATAADATRGKQLYEKNCISCHSAMFGGDGSKIYTRKDRRVHSLSGLEEQVRRCDNNLGLTWFDDQINDVVKYLNQAYYHFKE